MTELKINKSDKPTIIDIHNWIYHDRSGSIDLIHEVFHKGVYVQTDHIRITRHRLNKVFTYDEARP